MNAVAEIKKECEALSEFGVKKAKKALELIKRYDMGMTVPAVKDAVEAAESNASITEATDMLLDLISL